MPGSPPDDAATDGVAVLNYDVHSDGPPVAAESACADTCARTNYSNTSVHAARDLHAVNCLHTGACTRPVTCTQLSARQNDSCMNIKYGHQIRLRALFTAWYLHSNELKATAYSTKYMTRSTYRNAGY